MPDPDIEKYYESKRIFVREISSHWYNLVDEVERLRNMPRVIRAKDMFFKGGPQFFNKTVVSPKHGITQSIHMHVEELVPKGRSQKHYHQNEALMYILEGEGYEIHDGEEYKWKAGDLVLIHAGCIHQHFNASDDKPARALIIKAKPLYLFLNLFYQATIEHPPKDPIPGWESYDPNSR
jgi:quercetin dioxygenase-like cupin family protein